MLVGVSRQTRAVVDDGHGDQIDQARLAALLAAAEAPCAVLQALDRGVILVDGAGRVAYANAAAGRVLGRRDGLALDRGGALVAARPADTVRLRRSIAAAALSGAGLSVDAGGALALPRPLGRPYVVQILPLPPEQSLPGVPHLAFRPEAALLVSDPEGKSVLPEERLWQAYGLTRAEAALTVRLVEGMSVREAARALGVTENTAKAQLKAVFAKLEVNRQSALVRRVLGDLGGVGAVTATLNGHG